MTARHREFAPLSTSRQGYVLPGLLERILKALYLRRAGERRLNIAMRTAWQRGAETKQAASPSCGSSHSFSREHNSNCSHSSIHFHNGRFLSLSQSI